jgi:hypothetical protein
MKIIFKYLIFAALLAILTFDIYHAFQAVKEPQNSNIGYEKKLTDIFKWDVKIGTIYNEDILPFINIEDPKYSQRLDPAFQSMYSMLDSAIAQCKTENAIILQDRSFDTILVNYSNTQLAYFQKKAVQMRAVEAYLKGEIDKSILVSSIDSVTQISKDLMALPLNAARPEFHGKIHE